MFISAQKYGVGKINFNILDFLFVQTKAAFIWWKIQQKLYIVKYLYYLN